MVQEVAQTALAIMIAAITGAIGAATFIATASLLESARQRRKENGRER